MPFHELLRLLLSGGAYYDREGLATGEGDPPASRTSADDDDDEGPDEDEPGDAKAQLRQWQKYARRLRTENANRRAEMKRLKAEKDAADKALKDANAAHEKAMNDLKVEHANAVKTAVDTAKAEVTTQTKQEKIAAALKAEAQKIGAKDVDDLLKIIDASGISVDDKGEVVGVEKLLADTKTAKPHLFGATSTTTSTQKAPDPTKGEGKKAKDMTPAEYQAARANLTGMPVARRFG